MITLITQASAQTQSTISFEQLPWLAPSGLLLILLIGVFLLRSRRSRQIKASFPPPSSPAPLAPELSAEIPATAGAMPLALSSELNEILLDDKVSWLGRLRAGMEKTRKDLRDKLSSLLGGQKLDDKTLEQVHEVLFRSDMGVETADHLVEILRQRFGGQEAAPTWDMMAKELTLAVASSMRGSEDRPINMASSGPTIILVVGVNGVGKTTSIGKLAARYVAEGKTVLLCAGDTFRAAAIEQLQVWGNRIGVPLIKHQQGSDPASVAFDAVKAAKSRGVDILLIDTAGRLHSKAELMDELAKIKRIITKELPEAPHETWLVIDATNGQNAVQQVKAFGELIQLTGLVVTKLDGTAKGGVIVGIKRRFKLPIRYVGVGEKAMDLKEFSAEDYAGSLFS